MFFDQSRYDEAAGRILSFFMIINIINISAKQTFPNLSINELLTPILGLLYIIKLIIEFRNIKPIIKKMVLLEIIFVILIASSIIRYPNIINDIVKRYIWVIAFCVPMFSIATKIEDINEVVSETERANIIVFLISFISFIMTFVRDKGFTYENYNMTLGYTLLFPALYHLYRARTKKIYLILFAIELVIIIFYGSRGQLLCFLAYYFISLINEKTVTKRILLVLMVSFLFSAILLSWPTIAEKLLLPIVRRTGSRTLSLLMRGQFLPGTDRTDIWKKTIDTILEKPLIGWGLGGELSYLHSYPHNIFLELLLHFGVIFGVIISLMLLFFVFLRIIFGYKTQVGLILLFCGYIFPLILSGTYTEAPMAWIVVGYCFARTFKVSHGKILIMKR